MGKRDAEITVGADATPVQRAAAATKAAWKDAGDSLKEAFGSATRQVTLNLGEVALAQGKVNFATQHQQVREFEASTARLAVATGRDLESVRAQYESVGLAIGKRPQEVARWSEEVGRLTYDLGGATDAMRPLSALAAETGRSVDDYKGLAVNLRQAGVAGREVGDAIGVVQAQADALGNAGGVAALADQIDRAGDALTRFAGGAKGVAQVSALVGELGKNLSAAQAAAVAQQAISTLTGDPRRWERVVGHHVLNKRGEVENPISVMREITERTRKRYGGGEVFRNVMIGNFGAQLGSAMMNADYGEAAKLSGLGPSSAKAAAAQRDLLGTDAGRRQVAEAELAVSSRQLLGSASALGRAADALQQFSASNPLTGNFASTFASTFASNFLTKVTNVGGSSTSALEQAGGAGGAVLRGIPGASAIGKAAGALGKVGAVGALLYAEYVALSAAADAILAWQAKNLRDEDAAGFKRDEQARVGNLAIIRRGSDAARAARATTGATGGEAADITNATASVVGRAVSNNTPVAVAALVDELKKRGESPERAETIAKAIAVELVKVKFNVVNGTGGPVEVTAQGVSSAAAGGQG